VHIILINGSPRKNGATAKLNKALSKQLLELNPDIQLETIELGEVRPRYCDGCLYCYRKGECHIKDDGMEEISRRIAECDGLVLASPTYGSSVSGLFKTLIDRGHLLVEQALHKKPCIVMTTYANAQGRQTLSFMNKLVMTSGGYSTSKIAIKVPFNGNPISPQVALKLSSAAKRLYRSIHNDGKSQSLFSRLFGFVAFHIVLKPMAMKSPKEYRGVLERWVERGLMKKEVLS